MKRKAQPMISEDGQHVLDRSTQARQDREDLSVVTIRTNLNDLWQYISWFEYCWQDRREDRFFLPQAPAPLPLIRSRKYLQPTLGPSNVTRAQMHRGDHGAA
jgi:hypothetical protein